MKFVRGYAYFGAFPELAAVGKTRGRVDVNSRGIDAPDKPLLAPVLIHLAGFDELNEAAIEQPDSEALEDDGNDTRKP